MANEKLPKFKVPKMPVDEEREQLLDAAIELLKACKDVMAGGYGCAPSVGYMDKLKKQCESAIAKYEGRAV